jgi:hypothetical protein
VTGQPERTQSLAVPVDHGVYTSCTKRPDTSVASPAIPVAVRPSQALARWSWSACLLSRACSFRCAGSHSPGRSSLSSSSSSVDATISFMTVYSGFGEVNGKSSPYFDPIATHSIPLSGLRTPFSRPFPLDILICIYGSLVDELDVPSGPRDPRPNRQLAYLDRQRLLARLERVERGSRSCRAKQQLGARGSTSPRLEASWFRAVHRRARRRSACSVFNASLANLQKRPYPTSGTSLKGSSLMCGR